MPKYLILRGANDTGKSTSINNCWNDLVASGANIKNGQKGSKGDFCGILEYNKKIVGFFSWGDDDKSFKITKGGINRSEEWDNLLKKCDIVICACRPYGRSIVFLLNFFQSHRLNELFWISKFHDTTLVPSAQRTARHLKALIDVL